ncbi:hypothetical protein [Halopiger thermotolerans]
MSDRLPEKAADLPDHLKVVMASAYETFERGKTHDTYYFQHLNVTEHATRVLYVIDAVEARSFESGITTSKLITELESRYGTSVDRNSIGQVVRRLEKRGALGSEKDGRESVIWLVNPYSKTDPIYATDLPQVVSPLKHCSQYQFVRSGRSGTTASRDEFSTTTANRDSRSTVDRESAFGPAIAWSGGHRRSANAGGTAAGAENVDRTTGQSSIGSRLDGLTTGSRDEYSRRVSGQSTADHGRTTGSIDVIGETIDPLLQLDSNGDGGFIALSVSGKNDYLRGGVDAYFLSVFMTICGLFGLIYAPIAAAATFLFAGFWMLLSTCGFGLGIAKEYTAAPIP